MSLLSFKIFFDAGCFPFVFPQLSFMLYLMKFCILLKDIQISTNTNKYNHSIIVTQSVLTYHVSNKLPLIICLFVCILHHKVNGHHTICIMQQYVWMRLIRIEYEYREFEFNANHNLNLCGQALSHLNNVGIVKIPSSS